jgi:hypothetical protein
MTSFSLCVVKTLSVPVITATMKTIATPPYQKHMSARLIFDDRNATRTLFIVLSLIDDASEEGSHHILSVDVVPMECHISLFARYKLFSMHGGYLRCIVMEKKAIAILRNYKHYTVKYLILFQT